MIEFGRADPAEFGPCGKPLTDELGPARGGNAGGGYTGFNGFGERSAGADGAEGVELATLETQVVNGVIDAVRGKPRGFAAEDGQL